MHSHKKTRAITIASLLIGFIIIQGVIYFTHVHGKILYISEFFVFLGVIGALIIIYIRNYLKWNALKRYKAELEVKILREGYAKLDERSISIRNLLETVKRSEHKYQQLIEHAVYAIYITDLTGNITDVNTSLCNLTGYSKDDLLNKNIYAISDLGQATFNKLFIPKNGDSEIIETRLLCKNGDVLDAELDLTKFGDDEVFVVVRNITDRKRIEAELNEVELRFHTLAEKASIGVYLIQGEHFIYVNQKFAEIFGYVPNELIKPLDQTDLLITEDCREMVRENIQARHRGEADFLNYEVTGKKKTGEIIHIEFSGSRVLINSKSTIIGTMVDVTERWEKEKALRRYEANLQTILEITDTAYTLFDKELNITGFNQMAVSFVTDQYHHMPAKGDRLADYFPKDRFPKFLEYADKVLKGGNMSYEISYPQPDGSLHWYYVRLFPITNNENEIFGIILALSNITERKNAEENLKAAYTKIHNHLNSIQDMAWKQSHLVRSPLANLKGLITILKDDPEDKELIDKIQLELQRLDNVIIDLANDATDHENDS
jgi:two-component system, sporulation sensor kinase E